MKDIYLSKNMSFSESGSDWELSYFEGSQKMICILRANKNIIITENQKPSKIKFVIRRENLILVIKAKTSNNCNNSSRSFKQTLV